MSKSEIHFDYPLTHLKGADYNPRAISDESLKLLRSSIRDIGCVKPIIVRNKTIVAGHQRTKAMLSMGINTGPVILLGANTSVTDETRFNQLHNGTDIENLPCYMNVSGKLKIGFQFVDADQILGDQKQPGASFRHVIMDLILKYGLWGACVADYQGNIVHGAQYALACKNLKAQTLVYTLPQGMESIARHYLGKSYGVFSYDHLERNTFIQTLAQLKRFSGTEKEFLSPTYEKLVKPFISKSTRVLDFGCGKGGYVNKLRKDGYNIIGLEFFRQKKNSIQIDISAVHEMVDNLIKELRVKGLFDVVVCDYVMNSVDSQEAENDVLNCIQAFCKPSGMLFFSGRIYNSSIDTQKEFVVKRQSRRSVEFLDKNKLTAIFREGHWFYQKFHDLDDVKKICKDRGLQIQKIVKSAGAWNVSAFNSCIDKENATKSIAREFNMPMSDKKNRLNRHADVIEVMQCLLAN